MKRRQSLNAAMITSQLSDVSIFEIAQSKDSQSILNQALILSSQSPSGESSPNSEQSVEEQMRPSTDLDLRKLKGLDFPDRVTL